MKNKALPSILLLCAAALGLRLWGLDWMLPHRLEPDAQVVAQVRLLSDPQRLEDEQYGTYGLVTAFAAAALPGPSEVPPTVDMTLAEHRANASAEVVHVRLAVVLLSLLAIPATWWLARQALSPGAALFAGALVAFSLLHVSLSQQARPHAVSCGTYLLAVLAALHLRRRPGWGPTLLAGLAAGLAVGTLQSGPSVVPALVVAQLLALTTPWRHRLARIAVALAVVAALLYLFYPFLFQPTTSKVQVQEGHINQSAHKVDLALFNGGGFAKILWILWSYEPVLLVLAGLGLVAALRRLPAGAAARCDLLVVLAFAVPYTLAFGSFEGTQERMVLPLVPYLAVLAAFPLDAALRGARGALRPAVVLGSVLVLALPAGLAARLVQLRARDDTLEQVASWVEQGLQPDQDVALVTFPLDLPLFHDDRALALNREVMPDRIDFYPRITRWFRYQSYRVQAALAPARPAPQRYGLVYARPAETAQDPQQAGEAIERLHARLAIVELFPPARSVPGNARMAANLAAHGRRVARFSPWRQGDPDDLAFEHEGLPSHREAHVVSYLLRAVRLGPVIEVYELE